MPPPNLYTAALTPRPSGYDCIWRRGLYRAASKLKMGSCEWPQSNMADVRVKRKHLDRGARPGRMPCQHGDRHLQAKERGRAGFSLGPRKQPCRHLAFRLPASRAARQSAVGFQCGSHPACGLRYGGSRKRMSQVRPVTAVGETQPGTVTLQASTQPGRGVRLFGLTLI